ncbi:MAG: adenosylmethionine--8-amino-7-oxononanoate transaminase [Deltaproteobacteria bacterium]|nr:adenosylmethionine--8-amino-7-oxononanoate transaminase [Deltaproteobacteria bacterium]
MKTRDWIALDRAHVWHPFTQMQDWCAPDDDPLVIERAEGCTLIDSDGRRYIDGVSSLWVNVHGHRRREIDDAIRAQLDRVAHTTLLGLASPPSIALAERLSRLTGLPRVFYSDSGSTAVEVALKIAFQHWQNRGERQRTKFVALTDAYHGDTVGAVSVGGIDLFHEIFDPLLFNALRVSVSEGVAGFARVLDAHPGEVAAVIVEPLVQGAAGMLMQPPGYLAAVREVTKERGVLLIADEVATGVGRTGKMFACEHERVRPDLMAVAKGLTGGYLPLAATLATDEVYAAFLGEYAAKRTFFHGHTYTGNPLSCAAALANLDLFESERTLDALQPKIARLRELLAPLATHPHVGTIRQCGFMVGIELVRVRNPVVPYDWEDRAGARVCRRARDLGAVLRPLGSVVVLMPPLAISRDDLDRLVAIVHGALPVLDE